MRACYSLISKTIFSKHLKVVNLYLEDSKVLPSKKWFKSLVQSLKEMKIPIGKQFVAFFDKEVVV